MHCPHCGTPLDSLVKYCPHCKERLSRRDLQAQEGTVPPRRRRFLIPLAVVLVLVVAGMTLVVRHEINTGKLPVSGTRGSSSVPGQPGKSGLSGTGNTGDANNKTGDVKPGTQPGTTAQGTEQQFDPKHPVTVLEGGPPSKPGQQTLTIHDLNIFVAIRKRNYQVVQALLKSSPELVKSRNIKGATPLHLASAMGDGKTVNMLLDAKASVNAKCNQNMLTGQTPLHLAAGQGQVKILQILLAHEAAVDVKDSLGATPLHEAASHGQQAAAALLLANGANINAKQDDGYTPIFWAIVGGKADIVRLLIDKGADINMRTEDGGLTPLLFAESYGHREAIVALIKKAGGNE